MSRAASLLFVFLVLASTLLACQRPTASLTFAPEVLELTAKAGGEERAELHVGGATLLQVTATPPWLTATLAASEQAGEQAGVTVEVVARCPEARVDARFEGALTLSERGVEYEVPVRLRCLVARISALPTAPLELSGLVGQTRAHRLDVHNPGEVPVRFAPASDAPWLTVTPEAETELPPGQSAEVTLQASCGEEAGTHHGALTLTSDAPSAMRQTLAVTLTCREQLEPEQEGLVVRAGSWNWAENDDGVLGSAMLFGFRYLAEAAIPHVTLTISGPPSYHGGEPRRLTLEPPTFEPGQTSQDVWSYDLLTSGPPGLSSGPYEVTALSSAGDRYHATLSLDPTSFLPSPKALSVNPTATGVAVSWSEVPGARTYFVVLSDPVAGAVPPQLLGYHLQGLEPQNGVIYAKTIATRPEAVLESPLEKGRSYQVTVVAFDTALLQGGTETLTLDVTSESGFNVSSAALRFTYAQPNP